MTAFYPKNGISTFFIEGALAHAFQVANFALCAAFRSNLACPCAECFASGLAGLVF
jgi:hypothetical protein